MSRSLFLHQLWARLLSFLMAFVLSGLILVYPQGLINSQGQSQHGLLMLFMTGISIGFIHGVGFAPQKPLWRELLGPLISWPILLFGLYSILLK